MFFLLFIQSLLYSESIVGLQSYDYLDPYDRDNYFEGVRIILSEILLSDIEDGPSKSKLSERISMIAFPYEGTISIVAHDPADRAIEKAVVSEFMQRSKSTRLRARMLARDRMMPKLEHLRNQVHALNEEDPDFEVVRKSYVELLEKLREVTSYDGSSWYVKENSKSDDEPGEEGD